MDKYKIIKTIGKGAGGRVVLAADENGRQVAIKEITLDPQKKTRTKEAVLKEASILAHLKHPHVVSLLESFFDSPEEQLYIVQDFCDGGTLHERISQAKEENSTFSEDQIMQWFVQMTMALHHIHSRKVLHRDLKSQNVFLTKKGVLKIGDFGIARMMENTFDVAQTCCGTPCYLSPELCQDMPYSSKADVWALGCLLFEMCALRYAFDATNFVSLFYKIVKVDHGEVPNKYSPSLCGLIKQLLAKSPDERPSAGTLLNLPFVQDHLASFIQEKENLQEALHAKQLLKTAPEGTRGESPNTPTRPLSASAVELKSPDDQDRRTVKVRCKSARPSSRGDKQSTAREELNGDEIKQAEDSGEYSDDFDEPSDDFDESSDESGGDWALNGNWPKKPISPSTTAAGNGPDDFDVEYPDDFEDDSEEEVLDDILANARAAQGTHGKDEIVEDLDRPSSCKQKLKEHVITVLGEKMFEEVRQRFTRGDVEDVDDERRRDLQLRINNQLRVCHAKPSVDSGCFTNVEKVTRRLETLTRDESVRPEFERLDGSKLLQSCFLVNELFIEPDERLTLK